MKDCIMLSVFTQNLSPLRIENLYLKILCPPLPTNVSYQIMISLVKVKYPEVVNNCQWWTLNKKQTNEDRQVSGQW